MRKWTLWTLLATLTFTLIVCFAMVSYIPYRAMDVVMNQRLKEYPRNALVASPPTTEESRTVVRPSPDILYSICMYDVSEKPLLFTCSMPDGYWSLSFYAQNTDNFFVINDRQVKSAPVKVLLVGSRGYSSTIEDAIVVNAQGDRGLGLIRMIVPDNEALPGLIQAQKESSCRQID